MVDGKIVVVSYVYKEKWGLLIRTRIDRGYPNNKNRFYGVIPYPGVSEVFGGFVAYVSRFISFHLSYANATGHSAFTGNRYSDHFS